MEQSFDGAGAVPAGDTEGVKPSAPTMVAITRGGMRADTTLAIEIDGWTTDLKNRMPVSVGGVDVLPVSTYL